MKPKSVQIDYTMLLLIIDEIVAEQFSLDNHLKNALVYNNAIWKLRVSFLEPFLGQTFSQNKELKAIINNSIHEFSLKQKVYILLNIASDKEGIIKWAKNVTSNDVPEYNKYEEFYRTISFLHQVVHQGEVIYGRDKFIDSFYYCCQLYQKLFPNEVLKIKFKDLTSVSEYLKGPQIPYTFEDKIKDSTPAFPELKEELIGKMAAYDELMTWYSGCKESDLVRPAGANLITIHRIPYDTSKISILLKKFYSSEGTSDFELLDLLSRELSNAISCVSEYKKEVLNYSSIYRFSRINNRVRSNFFYIFFVAFICYIIIIHRSFTQNEILSWTKLSVSNILNRVFGTNIWLDGNLNKYLLYLVPVYVGILPVFLPLDNNFRIINEKGEDGTFDIDYTTITAFYLILCSFFVCLFLSPLPLLGFIIYFLYMFKFGRIIRLHYPKYQIPRMKELNDLYRKKDDDYKTGLLLFAILFLFFSLINWGILFGG